MPTYDFVCPARHEFERFFRKMSDAPLEMPCPECGAIAIRKVSGGAGLVFKGSGFYITDYGKDGKKPQGSPGKKDASKPGESSSSDAGGGSKAEPTKDAGKSSEASTPKPSSPGSSGGE
ncbi:MAG TPA: FmdB family zinc ribbon protein [Gemmatimonadaceae bacterium]|nr:FmdB family zinc ribbon protein [Gemmatimonadaceae bacterium]